MITYYPIEKKIKDRRKGRRRSDPGRRRGKEVFEAAQFHKIHSSKSLGSRPAIRLIRGRKFPQETGPVK